MTERDPNIVNVTVTAKPAGDFYELCFRLGHAEAAAHLDDKDWVMSTGAQLSVLRNLAASIGLWDAVLILDPLIAVRTGGGGNILPDHLAKN